MEINIFFLFLLIAITSVIAWRFRLLSLSGAAAAMITGSCIAIGFGMEGLVLIGVFFLSSSILSKVKRRKKRFLDDIHEKGSTRDWAQVAANGGVAALIGILAVFYDSVIVTIAFAISLAASNSDTWASEIGSLSKQRPYSVKTFTKVDVGTSGAISLLGTIAGFFGALLIAVTAMILFQLEVVALLFILLFGFFGMVVDTLIGAYFQAEYKCPHCGNTIESPTHCGREVVLVKGINWLRNDFVNFISCITAVLFGIILYK
ncbi:DUF92 domain-containing protein [Bacillus sp. B15-48]|uniref:DUF92 domain-containing protein n=1 Tax=Bacillus sp. B15-48 TaxID=1548601 RepID=UPI00193FA234|nr:DUF92 domain-containing protein [Bacillus sp. B15-48]